MKTHLLDLTCNADLTLILNIPSFKFTVIYKQAEQMQNGHFTATLHFPEYQNAGVRAHCSLPAGGVGDGTPALQGSPAGERASRGGN